MNGPHALAASFYGLLIHCVGPSGEGGAAMAQQFVLIANAKAVHIQQRPYHCQIGRRAVVGDGDGLRVGRTLLSIVSGNISYALST
jgi:hypothetical protein